MNYISYMELPASTVQYVEPINAWDSYGFSKDNPTRLYYESKGLTFEDYMKNTTEAQRRADMKVSQGDSKEEADNKAKVQGYRNADQAAKERILIEEGKLEAPKAINLLLAPTLPSTWVGAGTGAMDIKTGEAKDTPEGLLWEKTRIVLDLATPLIIGGAVKGGIKGLQLIDKAARRAYAPYDLYRTIGETKLPLGLPLNVGWAPKLSINVVHASNSSEPLLLFYPNRWDVVNEGANPFGIWYLGKLGTPRTVATNGTVKGAKAEKARELFASRPYQLEGTLTLEKPLQTIGDVPDRAALSYQAERLGADGIIYNGIYDNGYNNNLVILSLKGAGPRLTQTVTSSTPSKTISFGEVPRRGWGVESTKLDIVD